MPRRLSIDVPRPTDLEGLTIGQNVEVRITGTIKELEETYDYSDKTIGPEGDPPKMGRITLEVGNQRVAATQTQEEVFSSIVDVSQSNRT